MLCIVLEEKFRLRRIGWRNGRVDDNFAGAEIRGLASIALRNMETAL